MTREAPLNTSRDQLTWRIGIDNLSLPPSLLFAGGISEVRDYLHRAGLQQGLDWLPVNRSRLYPEIGLRAMCGNFENEQGAWRLIGSMKQSFSQKIPNIRTVQQVGERVAMPPVRASLQSMRRMQAHVGERLYANLYTEALQPGEVYDDTNAPFKRAQIISPDLAYKCGYHTIGDMVDGLHQKGIEQFTFDTVHSVREAQDCHDYYLQPWQEWLPDMLRQQKIGQISVSFARGDLKPHRSTAIKTSYDQLKEILSGDPRDTRLGTLPDQLATLQDNITADTQPLVSIHASAKSIQDAHPSLTPHEGHRLLATFVADRLGFDLPT